MIFLHGLERDAHVVAEIYIEGKWRMVDVTWQIAFPDARGQLMSAAEVHTTLGRVLAGNAYIERCRQLLDGPDEALGEGKPDEIRRRLARKIDAPTGKLWIFGVLNYPLPRVEDAPSSDGDPNRLTNAERSAGWRLLFDGHSLAGWRGYQSDETGHSWSVVDGAVVAKPPRTGDLVSVQAFDNFELSIQWRISDAGNSGILHRVGLGDPQTYHSGPEYQLLDDEKASGRDKPTRRAGALYDLIAPARDIARPEGEWNETRVVVNDWCVEHWLNGAKVVTCDLAGPEGMSLVAAGKLFQMPKFATLSRGHIALQDYGNEVSFRAIKIRQLPALSP